VGRGDRENLKVVSEVARSLWQGIRRNFHGSVKVDPICTQMREEIGSKVCKKQSYIKVCQEKKKNPQKNPPQVVQ